MPSMQGFGSRRLMANPRTGDKCASAPQQCTVGYGRPCLSVCAAAITAAATDYFALSAAAFLHSERNFLRSLPLSPLASASFEHSSEAAVRAGFSAFLSAGAIFGAGVAAGAGVAGAVVWGTAEPPPHKDGEGGAP